MIPKGKAILLLIVFLVTTWVVSGQNYLPIVRWDGPTPAAPQAKPGYLEEVVDPVYKTHFKRVTDKKVFGFENEAMTRHYYSLRPVFNRNSSKYIINWGQIRDTKTNALVGMVNDLAGDSFYNPTWSKVDPDILYGTMENRFVALNVTTRKVDTIYTFDGFVTKGKELYMDNKQSIAGDDQYIVVSDVPTGGKQVVVLDIQNRKVIGRIEDAYHNQKFKIRVTDNGTSIRMNVGISPYGNYIVLGGEKAEYLYDKHFNYIRTLPEHGHADFGIDTEGKEVYVSICPLMMERLEDGRITKLLDPDDNGPNHITYGCGHVNASANYLQPGWAYLSLNEDPNDIAHGGNGNALGYEIIAVRLDPNDGLEVRKIIHPHNTGDWLRTSSYGVPNPDGTLLMFNSGWDDFSEDAEIDAYIVKLTTD